MLAPTIEVARTLKCGMDRDQVKAAFLNVIPPNDISTDKKSGEETITWNDVTSYSRDDKECSVNVWIDARPGAPRMLRTVLVICARLLGNKTDHWGEINPTFNEVYRLSCLKTKKPAPK